MKILLIGEYSGVHSNLKLGLVELNCNVDFTSGGDGYKKIGVNDIFFPNSDNYFIRKFLKFVYLFWGLRKLKGYDVVQIIDHNIFGGLKYGYNYRILKYIKKNNSKMYLVSSGSSHYYSEFAKTLDYNPLNESKIYDGYKKRFPAKKSFQNNENVARLVDGIIPTTYSYRKAYEIFDKTKSTIPLPIHLANFNFRPQVFENNKIKILHGISRPGFKGSRFIIPALERIRLNFPDTVEIIIEGNIPFNEYIKLVEKVNIVVDQALSYEYGMNAVFSMALGKVVLSGNEDLSSKEFGNVTIPIINIKPTEGDIYDKLEDLILNKSKIIELSKKSRKYVERIHDSKIVAEKFLNAWRQKT